MKDEIKKLREPLSERLPEEVFSMLHQVVGGASMCWTDVENAGNFEAEKAGEIAFELCHYVADLIDQTREEAGDDSVGYITGGEKSLKRPMLLLQISEKMKAVNR